MSFSQIDAFSSYVPGLLEFPIMRLTAFSSESRQDRIPLILMSPSDPGLRLIARPNAYRAEWIRLKGFFTTVAYCVSPSTISPLSNFDASIRPIITRYIEYSISSLKVMLYSLAVFKFSIIPLYEAE